MGRTELREVSGGEVSFWEEGGTMFVSFVPRVQAGAARGSVYTDFRGREENARPGAVEGRPPR